MPNPVSSCAITSRASGDGRAGGYRSMTLVPTLNWPSAVRWLPIQALVTMTLASVAVYPSSVTTLWLAAMVSIGCNSDDQLSWPQSISQRPVYQDLVVEIKQRIRSAQYEALKA